MRKGKMAKGIAQREKDSRQWAVGSKSQTIDYETPNRQGQRQSKKRERQ